MRIDNYIIIFIILLLLAVIYLALSKKTITHTNYVSHSYEPSVGDLVHNNNVKCKHFKSCGKVLKIKSLDGGMGKVVQYRVTNDGPTYKKGDVLTKTMDQLTQDKTSIES